MFTRYVWSLHILQMPTFSHSRLQKLFSQKNLVQKCKNEELFCIKIAKSGLEIEERCQKMLKIFHLPYLSKNPPKTTKEIHFLKFLCKKLNSWGFSEILWLFLTLFRPILPFFAFSQKIQYLFSHFVKIKICKKTHVYLRPKLVCFLHSLF